MKAKIFLILVITLAFFTSCEASDIDFPFPFLGESDDLKNKTPIEIYEAAEEKINSLDSYTLSAQISIEVTVLGKLITVESESVAISQTTDEGKFLYQEKTNTTSTYDGNVYREEFSHGFQDEYMYQYYSNDVTNTQLCSPISTHNYKEYMKNKDEQMFDIANFEKQEKESIDGGWKLIFSDLSSDAELEYLKKILDFSDFGLDVSLEDISAIFTVDSDGYFTDMHLEFIFKSNEESESGADEQQLPKLIAEASYSGLNQSVVEKRNITNFTRVSDLRCLDKASDAFGNLLNSEKIDFTLTTPNRLNSAYTEIYNVNYSLNNGKPTYVMLIEVKSATGIASEASITYSAGKKIVTSNGAASIQESDDTTEKATIKSLVLPFSFNSQRVRNITTNESGATVFEIVATKQQTEQLLGEASQSWNYKCEFSVSVVYDGDMIKEYEYMILVRQLSGGGIGVVSSTVYNITELSYDVD